MDTTVPSIGQVLATADEIAGMPRRPVRDLPGIDERVLWSKQREVAGIMEFAPDARMPDHVHHDHSHHVWIVEGSLEVLGRTLTAGGYAHVPARVPHGVTAGTDGCTMFYVFTT